MMKNALSALYLLNGWMNFKGMSQIVQWEMEKNISNFGDLGLRLKITGGQRMLKNALFAVISPEGMN